MLAWLGVGCSFDASGEPTASAGSGVGSASGDTTGTSSSSTSVATTAANGSADATNASSGATADASSSASVDTGAEVSVGPDDSSSGTATSVESSTAGSSSGADPICGNGVIEPPETCETGDLGGFTCESLGGGYTGTAECAGCQIDDKPCCLGDGTVCVPVANDCCNGGCLDFQCGS